MDLLDSFLQNIDLNYKTIYFIITKKEMIMPISIPSIPVFYQSLMIK